MRANSWFNELVADLRGTLAAVVAAQAGLTALEAATLGRASGTGSIVFASGIANYGSGFQTLYATRARNGMCYVSGLIQNNTGGSVTDGSIVAQIPIGWRPVGGTLITSGVRAAGHARVDINTTGQISVQQFNWPNGDFLQINAFFPTN
jgi:hypothetical protein